MNVSENQMTNVSSILGVDVQTKDKVDRDTLDEHFVNPIIHKQIHGDRVYVPLDTNRLWPK